MHMPPTVEDVHDSEFDEKQQEPGESENELSSSELTQRQKQSLSPSEKTEERQKSSSSSSRPKTAPSTRSRSENEEAKSSRAASSSSSAASDDTAALLRSDNDNSPDSSDHEMNKEEEQIPIETPEKSDHIDSNVSSETNVVEQENISSQPIDKLQQRDMKGEYDTKQVIQLKESFQPIINEAASYGHLDIVRKLIEVISIEIYFFIYYEFLFCSVVKVFIHKIFYNVHHYMKHVLVEMDNLYLNFLIMEH